MGRRGELSWELEMMTPDMEARPGPIGKAAGGGGIRGELRADAPRALSEPLAERRPEPPAAPPDAGRADAGRLSAGCIEADFQAETSAEACGVLFS